MENNPLVRLYEVFVKPQTYLNLLYLFLAFPLGLAYFVFLVTGLSLGISLLILWIGLFILAGVMAICWSLTLVERQMAISLLKVEIPLIAHPQAPAGTILHQVKDHLTNPITWKGIAFLVLKFPVGLASFIITVTFSAVSLGLILAPLTYRWVHFNIGVWQINSLPAAVVACVIGLIIAPLSLHIINILAEWSGKFAVVMLGDHAPAETRATVNPSSFSTPLS